MIYKSHLQSSKYSPTVIRLSTTGLPIVYINTPNAVDITSKTEWTEGAEMRILDYQDGTFSLNYEGALSMRGRGNST